MGNIVANIATNAKHFVTAILVDESALLMEAIAGVGQGFLGLFVYFRVMGELGGAMIFKMDKELHASFGKYIEKVIYEVINLAADLTKFSIQ